MILTDQRQDNDSTSPESSVIPYEDFNSRQRSITGEHFPNNILELCDTCYWSSMCFNMKGIADLCPLCGIKTSKIPMTIEEICSLDYDDHRGFTIRFDRKNPIR
jgi:hypothetical protein